MGPNVSRVTRRPRRDSAIRWVPPIRCAALPHRLPDGRNLPEDGEACRGAIPCRMATRLYFPHPLRSRGPRPSRRRRPLGADWLVETVDRSTGLGCDTATVFCLLILLQKPSVSDAEAGRVLMTSRAAFASEQHRDRGTSTIAAAHAYSGAAQKGTSNLLTSRFLRHSSFLSKKTPDSLLIRQVKERDAGRIRRARRGHIGAVLSCR